MFHVINNVIGAEVVMCKMTFEGIETHNLKKINIAIPYNKVTVFYGRSGAGKSSLAFASIYKLCRDEFDAIESGYINEGDYEIISYSGIIPAVAMPQRNTNNNPRSTIYSYLNIAQALSSLKANNEPLIPSYHYLKINNYKNECAHCSGLGESLIINHYELINYDCNIEQKPFLCWRNGELSDYYHQLLISFCEKNNIDTNIKFKFLKKNEQDLILYGESLEKLSFRFKHKGKSKQRRAYYKGVISYANSNLSKSGINSRYKTEEVCPYCKGSRVNDKVAQLELLGFRFDEFLLLPISDLCDFFEKKICDSTLLRILMSIKNMGLGYLNLSRSIPSLSGGELQKLIFSRLLTSNTSGILIVIDEISSQVNSIDYPAIFDKLKTLSEKNTVILVEHSQYFIDHSDYKFHVGKYAGSQGGMLCEPEVIKPLPNIHSKNILNEYYSFKNLNKNNVINQSVDIPKECVTIFSGVSGSGKSSLAKAISNFADSLYVSQKLPSYTGRSTVASITNLNKLVAEYFAKKTGLDVGYFLSYKQGGCKACEGKGIIKYERGFEKDIYISCYKCDGKLFDLDLKETNITVNGLNIIDVYDSELKDLYSFFENSKIETIFNTINSLGISHLKLNRKTQSLSGGEMRRIKLCEILSKSRKTSKILFIDEPTAGLDPETASKVLSFIYQKAKFFNAIVIIEHRLEAEVFADYKISIGPMSGNKGGRIISQNVIL